MGLMRILLKTDTTGVSPVGFSNADAPLIFRKVEDLCGRCSQGACSSNLSLAFSPVAALANVSGANPSHGDTMHLGNALITFVSGTPTGSQVAISSGGIVNTMANLSTFINASATLSPIATSAVFASGANLTAAIPGVIGNGIQLSASVLTVTPFAGGSEGSSSVFSLGL